MLLMNGKLSWDVLLFEEIRLKFSDDIAEFKVSFLAILVFIHSF